jgi:predicted metal-dependent enzyme (double-stranded beta helix superfamily)
MSKHPEAEAMVEKAKAAIRRHGVTRTALAEIQSQLEGLAAKTALWSSDRFHDPKPDELQVRHFVREDPDQTFALYLNVLRPGKRIFPHNHTTWACVAAVEGQEHNTLHEIAEGGLRIGPAKLRKLKEIVVEPGRGIAMLPDDIHSVAVKGDRVVRHLHFYGLALEAISGGIMFDPDKQIAYANSIGVQTTR